ncbi:MAG TPA: hypothetical protein VM076_05820 [Gemmatimonadaceae bacterium]|nr:hypothetical protein [Gemmatimonadaceae bacterium]
MYSTCIFCHSALEANDAIEHFPVGRRLAFDAERGRLWVVCRKCRQWNLTPTEERWEAIEECERFYRDTKLRVSTDQIGLARLASGVELVRIGRPERPEFAAWRYGDQLGRRRRTAIVRATIGFGALGAVVIGGAAAGVGIGAFGWLIGQAGERIVSGAPDRVVARLHLPDTGDVTIKGKHLNRLHLLSAGEEGLWRLGLPHKKQIVTLHGQPAVQALAKLLPQLNRFGGSRERVKEAVALIENEADPLKFFDVAARQAAGRSKPKIASLPEATRLALEMAAHEDSERRALEGELALLEQAWKDAEEVAAIADNMFLPSFVEDWMRKHRKG